MADEKGTRTKLKKLFEDMMKVLYKQEGATFRIDILEETQVQNFIEGHTDTLNSAIEQVPLSDTMRHALEKSNYVFSGMKTFHELHEAFPKLIDENGKKKSFNRFLNDVQKIDKTYNENYLRAEYNFAHASASMAERWESFDDGDNYLLQYRTASDGKVREEHAQMHGITLPKSDSFWDTFFPPNGWNCRCTAVEVRKGKYPQTPHSEAISRAEQAMTRDKRRMFNFNPGKERKTFPDYNPYTIKNCRNCTKNKSNLAYVPQNELCQACELLHRLKGEETNRRLNKEERQEIKQAALTWAEKHLPKVDMPDGTKASRLTIETTDGYQLHIGKKLITETFSKCKNSRWFAKTMEMTTHVNEWAKIATHTRTEQGRHHAYEFEVFNVNYKGYNIEFKAKNTDGLIVYLMKIIS